MVLRKECDLVDDVCKNPTTFWSVRGQRNAGGVRDKKIEERIKEGR